MTEQRDKDERIQELLEHNSRLLERARTAERKLAVAEDVRKLFDMVYEKTFNPPHYVSNPVLGTIKMRFDNMRIVELPAQLDGADWHRLVSILQWVARGVPGHSVVTDARNFCDEKKIPYGNLDQ